MLDQRFQPPFTYTVGANLRASNKPPAAPGKGPRINQFKDMMVIGSRLCLLVAGVTLAGGSAFAQAPNPATPDTKPNLSKQLNQSNGVIHPKEVDSAIEKPAPKVGDPNVVPPPETSGGAGAPQPK